MLLSLGVRDVSIANYHQALSSAADITAEETALKHLITDSVHRLGQIS